jgi:alpha-mannosidase
MGRERVIEKLRIEKQDAYATHLRVQTGIGDVRISKRIIIRHDDKRIDFRTEVLLPDGQDRRLRVLFPLNFSQGRVVAESPFGWARRSEGASSAVNWVDYADRRLGLTLFNQGIPGYEATGGDRSLILIKGLSLEEPHGSCLPPIQRRGRIEKGRYSFEYSISSHGRNLDIAAAVRRGYELNFPLIVVRPAQGEASAPAARGRAMSSGSVKAGAASLVQIDPANMVACLMKKARKGEDLVVRL